jgi:ATP-dependent 26S proteasome regulatory subunit
VISKFVGESEEKLRAVFAAAHKQAPSIIFIDGLCWCTCVRSCLSAQRTGL